MVRRLPGPCPIWASGSRSQGEGPLKAGRGRERLRLGRWRGREEGRGRGWRDPGEALPASIKGEGMEARGPWALQITQ